MHPRILSHDDSRAASPAAKLGVAVGGPRYAGAGARTAHSPSADAQTKAGQALAASEVVDSAGLAPFTPSAASPTESERIAPVGTPADEGSIEVGQGSSFPPAASLRDVEGGSGNADMVDVIPGAEGAAPADAATWGRDAD